MTSLGKPLVPHILAQLEAFTWLMAVTPGTPRPPTAVEIAHTRNADLTRLDANTQRDIGKSAQDATGISTYQPDLPFFMQAGFR